MRLIALYNSCLVAEPLLDLRAFSTSSLVTVIGSLNIWKASLKNPPSSSPSSVYDLLKSYLGNRPETTSRALD